MIIPTPYDSFVGQAKISRFAVISAVNDQKVLAHNLMKSPMIEGGLVPAFFQRGYNSAGRAFNPAMERVDADILIFAHQDIYFPRGWAMKLAKAINKLELDSTPWAVLGVYGIQRDGHYRGRVWSAANRTEFGGALGAVSEVESIDDMVVILNRSRGLKFDEYLPGFQLYGADLCLQARQKGFKAYVFDGPVVHNSRLSADYYKTLWASYRHLQFKWAAQLPVQTCVLPIKRSAWQMRKRRIKSAINWKLGRVKVHRRLDSPKMVSRKLGYER